MIPDDCSGKWKSFSFKIGAHVAPTGENRICAMIDGRYLYDRLRMWRGGQVTRPFWKGSFDPRLLPRRRHEPFHSDLCGSRYGKTCPRQGDNLNRLFPDPSGQIKLAPANGRSHRSCYPGRRLLSESQGYGAWLTRAPVPLCKHPAMLAGRNEDSKCIAVMNHRPVHAGVDPFALGILDHDHGRRAYISSPIQLSPLRHGELEQINVRTIIAVLKDRAGTHVAGWQRGRGPDAATPAIHIIYRMFVKRHP